MSVITAIGYEWIFVLARAKTGNAGASWGYKLKRLLWFKTMTNIE